MDKYTKGGFFTTIALLGGCLGNIWGGLDVRLKALLWFMAADYITGLIVAVIFKKSTKTKTGGAQSKAGFIGLVRKVGILILIIVVSQIDVVLDTNGFFRNATLLGFMANEILSIIENAGLMGIKMPKALIDAVDVLKKQSEQRKD